jgi:hypothetical protein
MTTKNIGPYKEVRGADGRVRLVEDKKAKLAKLPVNQRIAAREGAAKKIRFVKRGGK